MSEHQMKEKETISHCGYKFWVDRPMKVSNNFDSPIHLAQSLGVALSSHLLTGWNKDTPSDSVTTMEFQIVRWKLDEDTCSILMRLCLQLPC